MSTDFVRIFEIPDLQVGDLLYVEHSDASRKSALYILPDRDNRPRGLFVSSEYDRTGVRNGAGGWPIASNGVNAKRSVKVLQRLRGVSREDVTERWDATLARLLTTPQSPASASVDEFDYDTVPSAEEPKHTSRKFGDPITAEDWRSLPPGSIVDTHDGSLNPLKHKTERNLWVWAPRGKPRWSAGGGHEANPAGYRATYVGHVAPGTTGEAWDRALLGPYVKASAPAAPKPLAVGDKVQSVADLNALPVGTVIQRPSGVWHRASVSRYGWRPVCLPALSGGSWPSLVEPDTELEDLQESRIIALNVVTEDRVVFARALAKQGYQPAADALAACPPPPVRVGDRVEVDDYDRLPTGTVVETEQDQEKLAGSHLILKKDGWQAVLDPGATKDLDAQMKTAGLWSELTTRGPGRIVALDANLAGTRGDFYKSLAEQGHEPSRAVMWAPAHRKVAEASTTPKIGDMLTPEQVAALPAGAIVEESGGDAPWIWQVTERGQGRCIHVTASGAGKSLQPTLSASASGRLIALDAPAGGDRRTLYEALAAQGYEPAAIALREAPKIGDRVRSGESGRLPVGTVVELPGSGGYDYVTAPGEARHVRMGTYELRENAAFQPPSGGCGGVIVALDVPATTDRRELARLLAQRGVASLQSACDKAGVEWRKLEPAPAPARKEPLKPGDRVDGRWDELPPGSVVDTMEMDPSGLNLAVLGTEHKWSYVLRDLDQPGYWTGMWSDESIPDARYLGQVPVGSTGETFTRALAACGYEPARLALVEASIRAGKHILEGANKDPEKDLDGTTETVQTQNMPMIDDSIKSVEYPAFGISCQRLKGESVQALEARAQRLLEAMQKQTTAPSLMQRLGASLKATGAGLANQAIDRAKVNAARVGLDAAKLGAHKAVVAIAEAVGGEKAAISTLRVVQMPQVQVVEDYAISLIADMAGRPALAAIARERAVERTVDGTFDFALSQVAKAGAQVIGALTSADEAATSVQQVTEGEVVS